MSKNNPDRIQSVSIRGHGNRRAHTGGPPVAFSVRDTVSEEEIGLYLIQLSRRCIRTTET